jgi:hypothetical protein
MFTIFINDKVITDVGMILEIGPCYGNVIEFISMLIDEIGVNYSFEKMVWYCNAGGLRCWLF